MPLKVPVKRKALTIAIAAIVIPSGIALTWYDLRPLSRWSELLTIGFVVLVGILLRTGVVELPRALKAKIGAWPRLSSLFKCAVCFILGLAWVAILSKVVSDTYTGVTIVLIPGGILFLASAFFFLKSVWVPLD
jgi:hypothetical protein